MSQHPAHGKPLDQVDTPSLLVDLDRLEANIQRMADFAAEHTVALRPHIKTHKCPEVARLQREAGAVGFTCAKVSEAEVFARAGFTDLLIANQITGPVKIDRLTDLAREARLTAAVDNPDNLVNLDRACADKGVRLGVLVEVDLGMKRCGVQPGPAVLELAAQAEDLSHLDFRGLQAYEGHLVLLEDPDERAEQVREAFRPLEQVIADLEAAGLSPEMVSGGGTGTYDTAGAETPLTELQVGSYVFMDATYGPLRPEFAPALSVSSTVVSRPVPERLVTDAGLKALTSEFGWPELLGGIQAEMNYLSEEHGVLTLADPGRVELEAGDRVRFRPSHVCTTVNLHDQLIVHRDGRVVDVWPIAARGCVQ
jgi:D-serine deaminase-like pyridoxal phosphate-dependent protein